MKTQRSRSLQLITGLFSATWLFASSGGRVAAAADIQGNFTCSLGGESSQIELAFATAQQRVPVRGRLEFEIQGSEAEVSELSFDTDPILFRGSETILEFTLDPSSLAVATASPFISHFIVPVSLLVTADPASPQARIEASLQINLGETPTGLLTGSLPGDRNSSPNLGFSLPVSCARDGSAQTVNVYGTLLASDGLGSDILISHCWCVHDSPDSPCTCYGPKVRIPGTQILKLEMSNRKGTDGRNLSVATMAKDTRIIVGRDPSPVDAGVFVQKTDVFAKVKISLKGGGVLGTAGAILGAFRVGYELGTKIDQATGASTALGDLLWDLLRDDD